MTKEESARWEALIEEGRTAVHLLAGEVDDAAALAAIEEALLMSDLCRDAGASEMAGLVERVFLALRRDLYILDPLMARDDVTEIMVNGAGKIFIEDGVGMHRYPLAFESEKALMEVIRRLASSVDREINELHPIVDARTADGARVNAVYGNIALDGPALTIRRFPAVNYTMEDLIAFGTVTKECASFLEELVRRRYNLFISGGTSSGKTTFLNVLSEAIPAEERVVVIEDSAELRIRSVNNLVRLECRKQNREGRGAVGMEDLIRTSLRMRPDRIIVGEVRGAEVVDMINAMNTGHDGSLSTGHGNSVRGMLRRLESMFLQGTSFPLEAIRAQIAEGIDLIVHLGRLADGRRVVLEVAEVRPAEDGRIVSAPLFLFDRERGLEKTGDKLQHRIKWDLNGEGENDGYPV